MEGAMVSFRLTLIGLGICLATFCAAASVASAQQPSTARSPAPSAKSDPTPLHGRDLAQANCAVCHGADGNSSDPQYPKIAGQKAYYIRRQLRAFRSGARKSDVMSGPASSLTENQIRELAEYFSDQPVKPDVVKDPKLAAVGARIFQYASRAAPPCVACHGEGGFGGGMMGGGMMGGGMGGMMGGHMGMMMGSAAVVPRLYGQHAAYLVQQLDAFASGTRRSPIMGPIASKWREQDRRAVAEYLSGLR
jgi:cytochrome c553